MWPQLKVNFQYSVLYSLRNVSWSFTGRHGHGCI
jgi:hypothetical protein